MDGSATIPTRTSASTSRRYPCWVKKQRKLKWNLRYSHKIAIWSPFQIAATAIQRPIFKESQVFVEIPEDTPVDSIVATVTASAAELNSSILYKLLGKEDSFTVDEYSGDVILKKSLDCFEVRRLKNEKKTLFILGDGVQSCHWSGGHECTDYGTGEGGSHRCE